MRVLVHRARTAAGLAWWWLRQVTGDAAYENYVRSLQRAAGAPPRTLLTRKEFYLERLRSRYREVNRCC